MTETTETTENGFLTEMTETTETTENGFLTRKTDNRNRYITVTEKTSR
jgi:hypothetical protein